MGKLEFLSEVEQNNLINTYHNIHKSEIDKCISNGREVFIEVDYNKDDKGEYIDIKQQLPVLTLNLKMQIKSLQKFFTNKYFTKDIIEQGTKVTGEELCILSVMPYRRKSIELPFLNQPTNGFLSNQEYFNRVTSFIDIVHPELNKIVKHNYGNIK